MCIRDSGIRCRVVVDRVVEQDLLVDLVGHQDQVVPARDVDQALHRLLGVDGAGRVVGVDDHQGVGFLGDLGLDVIEVRVPAVVLVAAVVHWSTACQCDCSRPQRIVGRGHEDLVAVVHESLQDHRDHLGDAVADEDVLDRHVQVVALVVLRYGGTGGVDPLGIAVSLRGGQVEDHVPENLCWRLEPERSGVADVEPQDAVTLGLKTFCLNENRTAYVVADMLELRGLDNRAHCLILSAWAPRMPGTLTTYRSVTGERTAVGDQRLPRPPHRFVSQADSATERRKPCLCQGCAASARGALQSARRVRHRAVNMTKLGSYMVGGAFTPTQFYAEVDGHPDDPGLARALEELAFLSRELLTLGVYGVAVPGRKRQFQVGTSSPGIFGGQLVVLQTGYTLRTCATCLSPLLVRRSSPHRVWCHGIG